MIFDIIIILIFLAAIWRGWHRGGIKAIFSLLTYILSFAIAFGCRNFITDWAMKLPFATKISAWASSGASAAIGEASKLPIISDGITSGAGNLTYLILQILSIIIVFFIVSIILGLIAKLLTKIIKFVHLGFVNRILGGAIGIINGYILAYIITLIAFAISSFIPGLAHNLNASYFAHHLPNPITLLRNIFGGLF